jgi:D-tyrosyl-tRNA(Tyr) deacylase
VSVENCLLTCRQEDVVMRAVVQRVSSAQVVVGDEVVGKISRGFLVLLGVAQTDTSDDAIFLAKKVAGLRIFEDAEGKMNLGLQEVAGQMLVVSQFTLYGDCRQGRRPSFVAAARLEQADLLYRVFVAEVRGLGVTVATGRFQQHMEVSLVNDGPVTLLLDSTKAF